MIAPACLPPASICMPGFASQFMVNPVLMDSYVGALVESLDNLSSFLASDSVVEKYCHALFAHLYLVDVVVAIC